MSFYEELKKAEESVALVRTPELDALYGTPDYDGRNPEVHVLDLSRTPTGTFKDFRNGGIIARILSYRSRIPKDLKIYLGTITSGNNGRSLEYWAGKANEEFGDIFRSVAIVDETLDYKARGDNSFVQRVDLSKKELTLEETLNVMSQMAQSRGERAVYFLVERADIQGITQGGMNYGSFVKLASRKEINEEEKIRELVADYHAHIFFDLNYSLMNLFLGFNKDLQDLTVYSKRMNPETQFYCPVGNGELMVGLHQYKEDYCKEGISIVGCTISENIFGRNAFQRNIFADKWRESRAEDIERLRDEMEQLLIEAELDYKGNNKKIRYSNIDNFFMETERYTKFIREFGLRTRIDSKTLEEARNEIRRILEKEKIDHDEEVVDAYLDQFRFLHRDQIIHPDFSFHKVGNSVADKLITPVSQQFLNYRFGLPRDSIFFGDTVKIMVASDQEILEEQRRLEALGIACEPSAAAGAAGARILRRNYERTKRLNAERVGSSRIPGYYTDFYPRIVIINTGKGKTS
jgi:hypothetical protein